MPTVSSNNVPASHTVSKYWLRSVYVLGLGLTALALTQFVTAVPQLYRHYTTICPVGCGLTRGDVAVLAAWGLMPAQYALVGLVVVILFALTCAAVGGVIFWQTARSSTAQPFAVYVALSLTLIGLCLPSGLVYDTLLARRDLWSVSTIGLLALSQILVLLLLVLFPDGRLTPGWLAVPVAVLTVVGVGGTFVLPFFETASAPDARRTLLLNGLAAASVFLAAGVQVIKYRREADPLRRRQTRWFVGAVAVVAVAALLQQVIVLLLPTGPLIALVSVVMSALLALSLPLAVGAAVLREHLWELPVFVNRALVYGMLSACVIGLYVVVVGGLGTVLQATGEPLFAVLASGVVALLALPLRDRLQRSVNQLLYGDRDDPYAVVARLGQQIERAVDPQTMLHTIVETVARALKLPYVAIRLYEGDAEQVAAAHGTAVEPTIMLPVLYRDELLGALHLAPRGDDRDLTARDRVLLAELARQAGVAIHTARLTRDLQRGRERLVVAREEERRRLRRDLHDGVGPTLASLVQRIDTAGYLVAENPHAATTLLHDIKGQVRLTIADIRQAVYDLRPPILDEWGLVAAIRDHTIPAQAGAGIVIEFTAREPLPPLPAAVEVAALRIVQEGLTNVVRHAQARYAAIRLALEGPGLLIVEVVDDGRGLPAVRRAGVGLRSMRERAEELGGTLAVSARRDGGTHVRAVLPVEHPPHDIHQWSAKSDG